MEVRRLLSTVVVDTLADETIANSTTSLREAIAVASAGDTVQFQVGLSGTVTLGGGRILINKNLTIAGPGAGIVAVSGNDAGRVLEITAGSAVSITGLTITRGRAEGGGAILNAGSLTLGNCVLSNNIARGADAAPAQAAGDGEGGAIYSSGTLAIVNSTFSANTAIGAEGADGPPSAPSVPGEARGGAIYSIGGLTVASGAFTGNTAVGGTAGFREDSSWTAGGDAAGGAIYTAGAAGVTIAQSTFSANSGSGGGNRGWSHPAGRAAAGTARGGAIRVAVGGGALAVSNTTFANNYANGGAGYTGAPAGPGGSAYGGAIDSAVALSVTGGTFSGNAASGGGGGGENYSDSAAGGAAGGGAVYATATASFAAVKFHENRAQGGAGGGWSSRMGGGSGTDIGGDATGGAMAGFANAAITRCTFTKNVAWGGMSGGFASGGAIDGEALTVTDSTFAFNLAKGAAADGVTWIDGMMSVVIPGGEARGGAIRVGGGAVTVAGSTFADNEALGGSGADAEGYTDANPGGAGLGGAVYAAGGGAIVRSTLVDNRAGGAEGGDGAILEDYQGPAELRAATGGDGMGGALYQREDATASITLIACTLAGNQAFAGAKGTPVPGGITPADATGAGGGVAGPVIGFANTLIATNTADFGPDVSGAATSSGFNLIGESDGSSGWLASDKTGTIAAPLDAKLGPLAHNGGPTFTMALLAVSPALDAGKAFGVTTDQRGTTRPRNLPSVPDAPGGDGSDIGAFELQSLPAPVQSPFKSFLIGATPLTIQAEDFDNGGEGIAYHDLDSTNRGGAYRSTGVDLQSTTDTGGGVNVGWAKAGEWLEYTVDVQTAGVYDVDVRVASNGPGGTLHLEVDGQNVSGPMSIANTFGWQAWTTITKRGVSLAAGKHVLRLALDGNGATGYVGNFNHLKVTAATAVPVSLSTNTAAHVRDGSYRYANYGASPVLEVKKSTTNYNREAYLKFDLSALASITSAKLRLYGGLMDAATPSIQLGVFAASSTDWTESGLTWLNKPATGASAVGTTTVSGTTKKWYEIDLGSFLKAEKAAGRNVVTLVLRSNTFTSTLCSFSSDEAANGPHLAITS
jgi:hypothetical protein